MSLSMAATSETVSHQTTLTKPSTQQSHPTPPLPQPSQTQQEHHRLSLPPPHRLTSAATLSLATGFLLGAARGGKTEALRFRAENAHRLPKSTKGWYLYHKSKNYAVMFAGVKSGVRMGGRLAGWVLLFLGCEALADWGWNSRKDFRSAALTGGIFGVAGSRVYGLSRRATGRTILLGLEAGVGYGLLQDAVGLIDGRRPEYLKMFGLFGGGVERP